MQREEHGARLGNILIYNFLFKSFVEAVFFSFIQSFAKEVQTHSQSMTSLNEMSRDLIDNHHSNDDSQDLQDTMDDLNVRWKKVMQR